MRPLDVSLQAFGLHPCLFARSRRQAHCQERLRFHSLKIQLDQLRANLMAEECNCTNSRRACMEA